MNFLFSSVVERVQYYIQFEAHAIFWFILLADFCFYKIALKSISLKRHNNLKEHFRSTLFAMIFSAVLSTCYWITHDKFSAVFMNRFSMVLAFFGLFFMMITIVKLAQIYVYLYLFFKNMSQGIPRLVANLFTVVFSVIVISYSASEVFSINVTAMLATSAVFSLVLGLALQDTLGNLFSGLAMQIGQPFKIGDWVEVNSSDSKKWMGQVQEITWRSTFITSFSDEWIMIPNKTIAQSQIIIFSNVYKDFRHVFFSS